MSHHQVSLSGHLHGVGRAIILAVLLSPWIFGYSDSHAAVANHIAFTMAFGPIALLIGVLRPAAYVLLLGAIWLVLSPWILGYAGDHSAWLAELVSGLVLMLVSARVLPAMRPCRHRQEHPRAVNGRGSGR
jgi:SPW repeat-containing protein